MSSTKTPWRRSNIQSPFWKRHQDFWDDFFGEIFPAEGRFDQASPVDVTVSDGSIVIRAALPGLDPETIDVDITGRILTISGERKMEKTDGETDAGKDTRRKPIHPTFRRAVRLPAGVQRDEIDLRCADGVLTIRAAASRKGRK